MAERMKSVGEQFREWRANNDPDRMKVGTEVQRKREYRTKFDVPPVEGQDEADVRDAEVIVWARDGKP